MNTDHEGNVKLTLPFDAIDRAMLPIAGGKAANLGELVRAGLPVLPGFCVTTTTYELVAEDTGLDPILNNSAKTHSDDPENLRDETTAHISSCTHQGQDSRTFGNQPPH
jgi:phosphoenolpyruvate synthase/pyruvate phosphate dikinase